jgi:hypothetical protein
MDDEEILTLDEAARSLGRPESSLRDDVANGRLHALEVAGTWTTTRAEVERYRREVDGPDLTSMDATGDDGQVFGG